MKSPHHNKYPSPPDPMGKYRASPSLSEIFQEEGPRSSSLYVQKTHSCDYRRFVGLHVRWLGSLCELYPPGNFRGLRAEDVGLSSPAPDETLWTVQLDAAAADGAFADSYHIQFLVDIDNRPDLRIAERGQSIVVCGKIAFFRMLDVAVLDDAMFHVYPEKLRPEGW